MKKTTLRESKPGEWFTLKPCEFPKPTQVWVKAYYEPRAKAWMCNKWSDINHTALFKSTKEIYIDFTF